MIGFNYINSKTNDFSQGIFAKYIINEFVKKKHEKINVTNRKMNELTIIYKIEDNNEKIKLFDDEFVDNNKENCKLIIENNEQELSSELIINRN